MKTLALVIVLLVVAVLGWIRLAPTDAARWHLDPATTPDPTTPNFARVNRVVAMPVADVAAAIAARAQGEGARRLAGDDAFATWVQRSRLMGYPDFISIRLTAEGAGTRIEALSRARFGHGDLGVNQARLRRWLPE